jgi:uncharacterized protein with HEPN domain
MKPKVFAYLSHIRDAIKALVLFAGNHTYEEFLQSPWDQAAVIRYLEIIGEASVQISQEYKDLHPDIPWRKISDFRNVLIHEYFSVDPSLVWEIMEKDIPKLQEQIVQLLTDSSL